MEAQRQIMRQHQIANPGSYLGGELVGAIPTVFIPVGGAAVNSVRAGRGALGTMRATATPGVVTGTAAGAGHDEGGVVERFDGAAIGGATGGVGAVLLSGAGVLIARGMAKTRIL
ncbi:hypothetical protein [Roseobacter weihaiensis]|uniref:hypothetical protein n=1 Tax=Roseobacter weihaiensis TaxID=2763262 RepID=UPI001D0B6371|nr:hypothetical protein [Roseobacter sp. H9]